MSLVTVDQILSGASNLMVIVFAAHVLEPADFGRFAIVVLVYGAAGGIFRALVSGPVLVHPEDADARPRAVLGSTIVLCGCASVFAVVVGAAVWVADPGLGLALVWLGVLLPLLMVQDTGRFLAIARAHPMAAIRLDMAWIVLEFAAFVALVALTKPSVATLTLVWGVTGAMAGLLVLVQYGAVRWSEINLAWLRDRWDFSWRYLISSLSTQIGALAGLSGIAAVSNAVDVAAVRAGTLLTRPAFAVQLAIGQASAADVARELPDDRLVWRYISRAAVAAEVAAGLNLLALLVIPDQLGEAILGQTWPLAEPLLLAAGLQVVAAAARAGIRAVLLGRRQVRTIVWADVLGTVVMMSLVVIGAAVGHARGALWANVIGQVIQSAGWWVLFVWHQRRGGGRVQASPDACRVGRS